jgi:hypothetical protein
LELRRFQNNVDRSQAAKWFFYQGKAALQRS